eukprot:gene27986-34776_t
MTAPQFRPLKFGVTRVNLRNGTDGTRYLQADQDLQAFPDRLTDRLQHWAQVKPEHSFMARRIQQADGTLGDWQHISYAQAWQTARNIAQGLIDRGLNAERPVVILSENSLEHALLALGCLVAGVPYVPTSPPYSLVSVDYDKLKHVLSTVTPGMVFASDARYAKAIAATVSDDMEVVMVEGDVPGRSVTAFESLCSQPATPAVDAAMAATGPDTIAKFLFTSGSTKLPKAVINTNRLWCANQQQMAQSMPVLAEQELVLVDWLPWNHTFGGNHNFGMTVFHGGTLYIDDGKPTPALMHETLRNLREIAPTVYFNVPTGFEAIAHAMQTDDQLRKTLLSRVQMFFYAGAALAQPIWDSLYASQEREVGERIVMGTGLGMTESGPFGIFVTNPFVQAGDLGVPTPGLELKLVNMQGKTEVRYRGPNITPGYWRNPEETASAFDEEGFFKTGDAVQWIDETDVHLGLKFDGRIAEDFKLATGTFVSVGPLRAKIIAAGAPFIQDAVLTGINLKEVGAMIFPTPAVRALSGLPADAPLADVLASAPVLAKFQDIVNTLAQTSTGSANRIARLCLLSEPPTIDKGEITDKGSINQRSVLTHRADTVAALHADTLHDIKEEKMASKGFFNAFADVWMHDGVRTPMVDYCGSLGHISPTDLGIKAAREALKRAGIAASEIGSVITGNMAPGDFDQFVLPRHIGLYAGVPQEVPAIMVQRICGTGFELFRQAGEQIEAGVCEAALVVGTESMTRNPIAAFDHRTGFKLGAPVGFKDFMWEALKDPAAGINMIQTAENLAKKYSITREEVDQFASDSFAKAVAAQAEGFHAGEIVPVVTEKFELEGYVSR